MDEDGDTADAMASWAADLSHGDLPDRVRRCARILRWSTVGAAAWTRTHPVAGRVTESARRRGGAAKGALPVPGAGTEVPPGEAAAAAGALSVALDFDDTLLGGHVSHSAVWVPLLLGAAAGADGRDVAAAQVAASEVAARLGAAAAVGPLRGQMTSYVHAAAAAVGRCRVEGRPPGVTAEALRLALSSMDRPSSAGFLGGDGKLAAVRDPVRRGLAAVDAAAAGLRGTEGVVEGPGGFLEDAADHPLPEFLGGLGSRWHTAAPTVKAHPACYYALAPVEAALRLAPDVDVDDVDRVVVEASLFTAAMEDEARPYLAGPESPLPALNFTVGWNVAAALADGEHTPRQLHPDRVGDASVWRVADAVEVRPDASRTVRALEAEIPVGLPLRRVGPKVVPYAAKVVGPGAALRNLRLLLPFLRTEPLPDDLAGARKAIGARVRVLEEGGTELEAAVDQPRGSAGRGLDELEDVARAKAAEGLEAAGLDPDPLVEASGDLADRGSREVADLVGGLGGGDPP